MRAIARDPSKVTTRHPDLTVMQGSITEDVDLDAGWVHVRTQLVRYDRTWHLDVLKTAASAAPIRLPPELIAALKTQRATQATERLAAGPQWADQAHITGQTVTFAPAGGLQAHRGGNG